MKVDGHEVVLQPTYYKSQDQYYRTHIPAEMIAELKDKLARYEAVVKAVEKNMAFFDMFLEDNDLRELHDALEAVK